MGAFRRLLWRRTVIANLADGSAVQGVLYRQSGPLLVIVNAVLILPGAEPRPVDGEIVIERDRVLFIQAL